MPAGGYPRTRGAMVQLLPAERADEAVALVDHFAAELRGYAELIAGRGQAGFMTRGRGEGFTRRAGAALARLGMSPPALAHHRALAETFAHVNGFLKAEWSAAGPIAACYFRRRPPVMDVLGWLAAWGVAAPVRAAVLEMARALRKKTIHFVAAGFRPEQPVHHKLYFSQNVIPATEAEVADQIAAAFALLGFPDGRVAQWRARHERAVRGADTTVYVSLSFTAEALRPSLKLDYSRLSREQAAGWADAAEQLRVHADLAALCGLAGRAAPSYVGVRFTASEPAPAVKIYCDLS